MLVRDMTSHFRQEPSRSEHHRRSHRRYPIYVDLEYKLLDGKHVLKSGAGRTVNLSSSGILFEGRETLPEGMTIRLSLNWPARLNERVGLTLSVNGRTVRSSGKFTAVEIVSHEFRTRPIPAHAQDAAEGSSVSVATMTARPVSA
ncbi:MAG TPA: PilZ domain-containing protein [Bryobacteraceae bacterium]|nr:PilZ domain-containing protein [Bryobacteraceae bacterium]